MLTRRGFALSTLFLATAAGSSASAATLPPAVPRRSDVCFSPRFGEASGADVWATAAAFHATRIDWTYGSHAFIAEARRRGYPCTASLSPLVRGGVDLADRLRSQDGSLLRAPWQPWPGAYWGCFNQPRFRERFRAAALALLDAGASGLQIDDAGGNFSAVRWGACWCSACQQKAKEQNVDLTREMSSFQRANTREFYRWLKASLPRETRLSNNNAGLDLDTPTPEFDFSVGELDPPQLAPASLLQRFRLLDSTRHRQVSTLRSKSVADNRRAISLIYGFGGLAMAPWDVYLASTPTGSERYYGCPNDFADLYSTIRYHATWFDGFELAALAAEDVNFGYDSSAFASPSIATTTAITRRAADGRLAIHCYDASRAEVILTFNAAIQQAALAMDSGTMPLKIQRGRLRTKVTVPAGFDAKLVLAR